MAVVRARSTPPYGLILFVFLTVVFAALAIVFYLQGAKADKDRADAEAQIGRIASPTERRTEVQDLLTGNPNGLAAGAGGAARAQAITKAALDTTTSTLHQVQSDLAVEKANNATMSQKLDSLQGLIAENNKNSQASIKSANDTVDQLKGELVKANSDLADLRAQQQTATDSSNKSMDQVENLTPSRITARQSASIGTAPSSSLRRPTTKWASSRNRSRVCVRTW